MQGPGVEHPDPDWQPWFRDQELSTCEGKIKKLDAEKKVKDKQIRNNETNNLIYIYSGNLYLFLFCHGRTLVLIFNADTIILQKKCASSLQFKAV